jgi:hypothetical protein
MIDPVDWAIGIVIYLGLFMGISYLATKGD